jgi:hypothetical protein
MTLSDYIVIIGVLFVVGVLIYWHFSSIRKRSFEEYAKRRIRGGGISTGFKAEVELDSEGNEVLRRPHLVSVSWVEDPTDGNVSQAGDFDKGA